MNNAARSGRDKTTDSCWSRWNSGILLGIDSYLRARCRDWSRQTRCHRRRGD